MRVAPGVRPVLAAVLSVLQPGLGHVYLRAWPRTLLWVGLWLGSLGLIVTTAGIELTTGDAVAAAFGVFAATEGFPLEAVLSMLTVTALATLDAYLLAGRRDRWHDAEMPQCPHCRKDLDPALDFCHWCTFSLEREGSA